MRRVIRRIGAWLVDWADRGIWMHICTGARDLPHGFSYGVQPLVHEPRFTIMQLGRGEVCHVCGERRAP